MSGESPATEREQSEQKSEKWLIPPMLISMFFVFASILVIAEGPKKESPKWVAESVGTEIKATDAMREIEGELRQEGVERAQCASIHESKLSSIYERGKRAFPAERCQSASVDGGWTLNLKKNGVYRHAFLGSGNPSAEDVKAWEIFLKKVAEEVKRNEKDSSDWVEARESFKDPEALMAEKMSKEKK